MSVAQLVGLDAPGEVAVHDREVGGEGVTYNAPLRDSRPRICDRIWGSSSVQNNISTNETNKEWSLKYSEKNYGKWTNTDINSFKWQKSDKSDSLVAMLPWRKHLVYILT